MSDIHCRGLEAPIRQWRGAARGQLAGWVEGWRALAPHVLATQAALATPTKCTIDVATPRCRVQLEKAKAEVERGELGGGRGEVGSGEAGRRRAVVVRLSECQVQS